MHSNVPVELVVGEQTVPKLQLSVTEALCAKLIPVKVMFLPTGPEVGETVRFRATAGVGLARAWPVGTDPAAVSRPSSGPAPLPDLGACRTPCSGDCVTAYAPAETEGITDGTALAVADGELVAEITPTNAVGTRKNPTIRRERTAAWRGDRAPRVVPARRLYVTGGKVERPRRSVGAATPGYEDTP